MTTASVVASVLFFASLDARAFSYVDSPTSHVSPLLGETMGETDLTLFPYLPYPLFVTRLEETDIEEADNTDNDTNGKQKEATKPTLPLGLVDDPVAGDRINQGEDASSASTKYGHYVALLGDDGSSVLVVCGGTLLSPLYVLTAAHCVYDALRRNGNAPPYLRGVSIGFFGSDREDNLQPPQRIAARHYYVHKKYTDASMFLFDLAVVELEEPTYRYEPSLPDLGNNKVKLGDEVTVVGMGLVADGVQPRRLQQKHLRVMPNDLCEGWWMSLFRHSFENSVTCTYADNFAGGICRGDSGGPIIQVSDDGGPDTVIALVSFFFSPDHCDKSANRRLPDGNARVVMGRDDLWGPLVCNSNRTATDKGLRPLWCDGQGFATLPPPDPIAQNQEPEPSPPSDPLDFTDPPTGRYPYYVGLQLNNTFVGFETFECMGTLIHPYFVLTMAECVNRKFGDFFSVIYVRVGWNCMLESNCRESYEDRTGVLTVAHPSFHKDKAWEKHNVGLIRLDRPVTTDFVGKFPILDDGKAYRKASKKRSKTKDRVRAVGVGKTTPDVELISFSLAHIATTLVKDRSCKKRVQRFFDSQYGRDNVETITDGYLGCSNRLSVSAFCLSLFGLPRDRLIMGGSPLVVVPPRDEPEKHDIVLGTLNFRTDEFCRTLSTPDVYNRMSAYREWIQCVVCVGSINATLAADLPPKADPLCAPKQLSPTITEDCRNKFGISPGMYDEEWILGQNTTASGEKEKGNVPKPPEACLVEETLERRNSTFELNPHTGEMAKCGMIRRDGLESLLCGESQVVQDAREKCPHICGLCGG